MKILSLRLFFCGTQNIFWRMLVTKQFSFPLTFIVWTENTVEVDGNQHFLVTNILQNILFSVEMARGQVNHDRTFIFGWTILLSFVKLIY